MDMSPGLTGLSGPGLKMYELDCEWVLYKAVMLMMGI
jgi:hypothetical protein